jgi:hypothetical protein
MILSPFPTAQDFASCRRKVFFQAVALFAKFIDFIEHSFEQSIGRSRGYPSPLKLSDFAALAVHLHPPALDLSPNVVDVRHGSLFKVSLAIRTNKEQICKPLRLAAVVAHAQSL